MAKRLGGALRMDLLQEYQTVVMTRGRERGDIEFGFLAVPRRMIDESVLRLLDQPEELIRQLDLEAVPIPISGLVGAIFSLLVAENGYVARDIFMSGLDSLLQRAAEDPELGLFAEYPAFAEVIPFEQSRMTNVALVTAAVGGRQICTCHRGSCRRPAGGLLCRVGVSRSGLGDQRHRPNRRLATPAPARASSGRSKSAGAASRSTISRAMRISDPIADSGCSVVLPVFAQDQTRGIGAAAD
jgi:hypothetical protein